MSVDQLKPPMRLPRQFEDAAIADVVRKSRERRIRQLNDNDLGGIKRADAFDVILGTKNRDFRLIKVRFERKGGIRVVFPRFHDSRGILSEVEHASGTATSDVSLTEEGFLTSHIVKYSHYPDGEAHFSQDRKIFTKVRRKAVSLANVEGHLFTVYCRGVHAFDERQQGPGNSKKGTEEIRFLRNSEPDATIKLTGYLFSFHQAKIQCITAEGRSGVGIVSRDGEVKWGIMMTEPAGRTLSEHLLLLTYEEPELSGSTDPYLLYLGGFDPAAIVEDAAEGTRFLALMYPAGNYAKLREELESVDFMSGEPSCNRSAPRDKAM